MLNDHLAALAAGASVPVPVYDYVQYNRGGEVKTVHPAPIVVVEGILVLWEPTLRDRFDLKVFVDTDADIRLIRRIRRDAAERGRTTESVIEQYLTTVRPAHEQFIEPSKRYADVIVPQGGLNRPALDVLLARVEQIAGGQSDVHAERRSCPERPGPTAARAQRLTDGARSACHRSTSPGAARTHCATSSATDRSRSVTRTTDPPHPERPGPTARTSSATDERPDPRTTDPPGR